MSAAVSIHDIAKSFGPTEALKGVTFDVPKGSLFGLLGPNGAGKTTLFSIIANFLKPNRGHVQVLDIDVTQISRLAGRMTILPQDALFQRNVPIVEQLQFFGMLDGRTAHEAEAEAKRTLERVGLGEYVNRRVHALSHGMVKRLGLAQAFLGQPEIILLDEPTSGLDPKNARQIRDMIREFHKHATIVVSSHNLAEIQELCDHVAILDHGNLVASASVAEITQSGRQLEFHVARQLNDEETKSLEALRGVTGVEERGQMRYFATLDLTDADAETVVSSVVGKLHEMGLTPRYLNEGNSLEEVFLKVTGSEEDATPRT